MPLHDWTRVDDGVFHDFHTGWIGELRKVLNGGLLPEGYSALAEAVLGGLNADVLTLEESPFGGNGEPPAEGIPGTVAVAVTPPRVRLHQRAASESFTRHQRRIVIRHHSGDRIVALIEVVPAANKASDYPLRQFVDKTLAALHRGIHVLILDLRPAGPRDPEGIHGIIWPQLTGEPYSRPPECPLTLVSYTAGLVKDAFVEPLAVGSVLTSMPLFLNQELYIPLPLEETYLAAYAGTSVRYRRILER
jgi:hypothetical protein